MSPSQTPHTNHSAQAQEYLPASESATPGLQEAFHEHISQSGPIPFSEFMQRALYDPEHGYYSAAAAPRTGRSGDFFTNVSVGPLFGQLIAERCFQIWLHCGKPSEFSLIEIGAHDGTLALDILTAAQAKSSEFFSALHYHLIESSPSLRSQQTEKLSAYSTTQHSDLKTLPTLETSAVCFSNELYDAFPVDLLEYNSASESEAVWRELRVTKDLRFLPVEIDSPRLHAALPHLPAKPHPGTRAEVRLGVKDFVNQLATRLPTALFITFDYGFAREELYHPDRIAGTLTSYKSHQRIENVLSSPGSQDLTAHVDFTQLAEAHEAAGHQILSFEPQSSYLTKLSKAWLLDMESKGSFDPRALRQLKSLTHPGIMGRTFQVLEAAPPDLNLPVSATVRHRL